MRQTLTLTDELEALCTDLHPIHRGLEGQKVGEPLNGEHLEGEGPVVKVAGLFSDDGAGRWSRRAFEQEDPEVRPKGRRIGIFYENAVNRILQDIVKACRPVWAKVSGEFTARGGLRSCIEATYP